MLVAALIGLLFGFFGSIPIAGPISALVLRRGLDHRHTSATLIGLGGALAEGIYAFLAFFGFASFLTNYPWIDPVSRALAAVMLAGLGISFALYKNKAAVEDPKKKDSSPFKSFVLGFTITILNPTLIATWAATATTLYSTKLIEMTPLQSVPFALGATVGIGGWFSLFSAILKRYGKRFNPRILAIVIRLIGVALIGVSVYFTYLFALWLLPRL